MDKVILDTEVVSSTENKNHGCSDTSTDESLERCRILDWNLDEHVAEGVVYSTDQTEMVNNISLGPNAVVLKFYKVINNDANLWRPSAEIFLMGDAINSKVAWPVHKIEMVKKRCTRTSSKISNECK